MAENDNILLDVKHLKKYFATGAGGWRRAKQQLHAVDDVSFTIRRGETFGLVGESGSGKSTTGRSIVRLHEITDGEIWFDGVNVAELGEKALKPYRKRMQMIFQDPYSSLNPNMNVEQIIREPMEIHRIGSTRQEQRERTLDLLQKVGLKPEYMERFPHEFSGGQRQRISIARALSVQPEFILCDEPISALDVSIQAQVVNMLEDLQAEFGLTYLFIAHDLSMVRHISSRIGVMYRGRIVELAPSEELYTHPVHPYTRALLAAIPIPDPKAVGWQTAELFSEAANFWTSGKACKLCGAKPEDTSSSSDLAVADPIMHEVSPGHFVACHAE